MTYFWPILASLFEAGFIITLVFVLWWLVTAPVEEDVTGFQIKQVYPLEFLQTHHYEFLNEDYEVIMPILGITPGATGTFTQSPLPVGAVLPAGVIASWTSSDSVNAPVVASADGTSATVAVPSTANVTSFSLTVSAVYTDAAGTHSPSTTVSVPINLVEVTGFDIEQTS